MTQRNDFTHMFEGALAAFLATILVDFVVPQTPYLTEDGFIAFSVCAALMLVLTLCGSILTAAEEAHP